MPRVYRAGDEKKRDKAKFTAAVTMIEQEAPPETVKKLYDDPSFYTQTLFTVVSIGYKVSMEASKGKDKAMVYKASVFAQWADMKDAGMTMSVSSDRHMTHALILLLAILHEYKFRLDIIAEDDIAF